MASPEADGRRQEHRARGVDLDRRQALKLLGGASLGVGGAKAIENVFLGFGVVSGTNLFEQSLGPLARAHLRPSPFSLAASEHGLVYDGQQVGILSAAGERLDALPIPGTRPARAGALDEEYGLTGGPLAELATDLPAIEADATTVEFTGVRAFFDRLRGATTRPFTVAALRGAGFPPPPLETVRAFAGVDPAAPEALVDGLAVGFRDHTRYDLHRYTARSVQQHVLFGAADLDRHFRSPTDFDALLDGRTSGMLCWDLTYRSIEAFHAVEPHRQTPPVVGAVVTDARHGHVYTGLASVVREAGDVIVPMTFLDYRNATLFDDLSLRGVLGEGIDAYNGRHRATRIAWDR